MTSKCLKVVVIVGNFSIKSCKTISVVAELISVEVYKEVTPFVVNFVSFTMRKCPLKGGNRINDMNQ